jgi:hypothetical protein
MSKVTLQNSKIVALKEQGISKKSKHDFLGYFGLGLVGFEANALRSFLLNFSAGSGRLGSSDTFSLFFC